MHVAHFHDDQTRLVKHRAYAYSRAANGDLRLSYPVNERAGAGGVFSDVRDLVHWDENFYSGRVGGKELIAQLETPGRLNSGSTLTYAWGLQIGNYRGQRIVDHSGSLGGYRTHLIRFPGQHFSVACLCNMASINPGELVRRVADVYLGDALAPVAQRSGGAGRAAGAAAATGDGGRGDGRGRATAPTYTSAQLAGFAGSYFSDELDAIFVVSVQNNGLSLRRESGTSALTAAANDEFRTGTTVLRFSRAAGGAVDGLSGDAGRVRGVRFVKR
jgi:hypothetical protein